MASGVSVTVGVDTHADAHVGVALDQVGRRLGEVAVGPLTTTLVLSEGRIEED